MRLHGLGTLSLVAVAAAGIASAADAGAASRAEIQQRASQIFGVLPAEAVSAENPVTPE